MLEKIKKKKAMSDMRQTLIDRILKRGEREHRRSRNNQDDILSAELVTIYCH